MLTTVFLAVLIVIILLFIAGIGLLWWLIRWVSHGAEQLAGSSPRTHLTEVFFALQAWSWREIFLLLQRAQNGKAAEHPMGSFVFQPSLLDQLAFDPATLEFKEPRTQDISLAVTIGPRTKKPLKLELPVLIAPMAYGMALSADAKLALAQISSLAGSATSSGEGPFLPEERAYAYRWVLQWSQGPWNHQKPMITLADMIEIHLGQGAEAAIRISKHKHLPRRLKRIAHSQHIVIRSGTPRLPRVLNHIKALNPDVPLGVKLPATNHIERDLAILTSWPIDVVTLDGQEAGSSGSPAVISDHFGISTAVAIKRARTWLDDHDIHHISLIASGGIKGAADIAKLLALGADAVAVGSAILFAMSHMQLSPFMPTTLEGASALVFAGSAHQKRPPFDVGEAVEHGVNWFNATASELRIMLEAMGLTHINQLRTVSLIPKTQEAATLLNLNLPLGHPNHSLAAQLDRVVAEYQVLNQLLLRQYRLLNAPKEMMSHA
ncbi:glutamate synthase conserved region-containing protein [Sulfobacillus thermosulfidooxidans DSM 9293]|uniref:Glutamate synthase conserved region-containing protein n=1 Tax=Sulfobacillus thermosulfidooxidans (strain DSM 9293 / VKM B-1269 / AT-1) TaxID=929705 RepID=A0A1W1WEU8_SULTA|nr:FMN-binding glutamate synthase family protein [Sulfobacillus thermosulfidooxidans]SMC04796.1 glutamate synthase conserved region-containing protein [Sulfobacillus thermosulfidooxidans DSM 9293]